MVRLADSNALDFKPSLKEHYSTSQQYRRSIFASNSVPTPYPDVDSTEM